MEDFNKLVGHEKPENEEFEETVLVLPEPDKIEIIEIQRPAAPKIDLKLNAQIASLEKQISKAEAAQKAKVAAPVNEKKSPVTTPLK
jgi:hypothetical protein